MNDIAQNNLQEPNQVDWENLGKSSYQAPPPEIDQNGKPIIYWGKATVSQETAYPDTDPITEQPVLTYALDPITITKSPVPSAIGYTIRFGRASTRVFCKKVDGQNVPIKGNPNSLAQFLRACGSLGKPQLNSEYAAAVNQVKVKEFPFTVQWEARNKETGEVYRGQASFPIDPQTGKPKTILKAGDVINVLDSKGNLTGQTQTVKADTIFVNAKLRYFQDPKKGQVQS